VDHSRQTGRPPLPTPRFRTVDGRERPASARATRSRFRSGSGTRTASAAAALRERRTSADCAVLCCAVRRSSRRVRRSGMGMGMGMEKKHGARFKERELPAATVFFLCTGVRSQEHGSTTVLGHYKCKHARNKCRTEPSSNGSGNTAPTRLDGRVSDKCRIEFESSNRYTEQIINHIPSREDSMRARWWLTIVQVIHWPASVDERGRRPVGLTS
jgi:hypothetical protein